MKVKQFLGSYNIGRSSCQQAVIVDTQTGDAYTFSKREIMADAYGPRGDLKINTFTITDDRIVIYTN